MDPVKITDDVYWVGGIDWDLRDFHGYITQKGSTYNSYLIIDEKITLIDTVKHYLFDEMIERISKVVDPSKIDTIISNHVEMDHSGSLPLIKKIAKNVEIVTSPHGEKGLKRHFKEDWKFKVVKTGDSINIGKRDLAFVQTPMVHWPDNMVTYSGYDKLLFSNDAFGQHYASSERFDDNNIEIIIEEAKKYYANIVLPYSKQVRKALEDAGPLDIEIIAPSHGIIWRKNLDILMENYQKWSNNKTDNKALIIYDTMWNSTGKIAYAIQRAFENRGVATRMLNLKSNHISDIMTEVLSAEYICIGSPTLNKNMLPTVSAFLTYLKGLAPQNRKAIAFGSYGWAQGSVNDICDVFESCKFELLDKITVQFIPDEEELDEITRKVEGVIQ
ncbi:FprA family A-type flavoprotein [Spirochaetota bacterium]